MKKHTIMAVVAIIALVMTACTSDTGTADITEENTVSVTESVSEETTTTTSETEETTAAEEDDDSSTNANTSLQKAEEQIAILKEYYNNAVINDSAYGGEIYDISGTGDCILYYEVINDLNPISMVGSDIKKYFISVDNGQAKELMQGIESSGFREYFEIKKYANSNKYYLWQATNGVTEFSSEDYYVLKYGELVSELSFLYEITALRLKCSVNGIDITEKSREDIDSVMKNSFSSPEYTRMDGDIAIYIPDYSALSSDKLVYQVQINTPQNLQFSLNGDKAHLTWDSVGGADTYIIYRKTGDQTEYISDSSTNSADVDIKGDSDVFCVTAYSNDEHIMESDYSEEVTVFNFYSLPMTDLLELTYADFIGHIGDDYQMVGEYGDKLASSKFPDYYFYCRPYGYDGTDPDGEIIKVQCGKSEAAVTDRLKLNKNLLTDAINLYNIDQCVIGLEYYPAGDVYSHKLTVSLDIDNGYTLELIYSLPEDAAAEQQKYLNDFSAGKITSEEYWEFENKMMMIYGFIACDVSEIDNYVGKFEMECSVFNPSRYYSM